MDSPTLEHMFQHSSAYRKLKELFAAAEYEPPAPAEKDQTVDASAKSRDHQWSSSDGLTTGSQSAASHALYSISPKLKSNYKEQSLINGAISAITNDFYWTMKTDKRVILLRVKSIFLKSFFVLINDYSVMILGLLFHVLLALNFYLFLEDASDLGSPVMAFFSISASILLISNVIWAFYLFKYNEV
jgi:hypothetical protein